MRPTGDMPLRCCIFIILRKIWEICHAWRRHSHFGFTRFQAILIYLKRCAYRYWWCHKDWASSVIRWMRSCHRGMWRRRGKRWWQRRNTVMRQTYLRQAMTTRIITMLLCASRRKFPGAPLPLAFSAPAQCTPYYTGRAISIYARLLIQSEGLRAFILYY